MNEIFIYDYIGPDYWGLVSAKSILGQLAGIKGKPVTVRINSNGGDVVEAQGIYNALRRHSADGGEVTVEIDALAASAASYVAMAGDTINIAENAMLMIHKAWTLAMGNADQLRDTAGILDKFDGILAATYSARTGMEVAAITDLLSAETWLTAAEAVEKGFADAVGTPLNVAAAVRPGRFTNAPQRLVTGEPGPAAKQRQAAAIERARQQLRIDRQRMGV